MGCVYIDNGFQANAGYILFIKRWECYFGVIYISLSGCVHDLHRVDSDRIV